LSQAIAAAIDLGGFSASTNAQGVANGSFAFPFPEAKSCLYFDPSPISIASLAVKVYGRDAIGLI
jgi:hypothetical protein